MVAGPNRDAFPVEDLRDVVRMDALEGADALCIMTEWKDYHSPDFAEMYQLLKSPVIFDGRNLYDPNVVRSHGFDYYAIGRASLA